MYRFLSYCFYFQISNEAHFCWKDFEYYIFFKKGVPTLGYEKLPEDYDITQEDKQNCNYLVISLYAVVQANRLIQNHHQLPTREIFNKREPIPPLASLAFRIFKSIIQTMGDSEAEFYSKIYEPTIKIDDHNLQFDIIIRFTKEDIYIEARSIRDLLGIAITEVDDGDYETINQLLIHVKIYLYKYLEISLN